MSLFLRDNNFSKKKFLYRSQWPNRNKSPRKFQTSAIVVEGICPEEFIYWTWPVRQSKQFLMVIKDIFFADHMIWFIWPALICASLRRSLFAEKWWIHKTAKPVCHTVESLSDSCDSCAQCDLVIIYVTNRLHTLRAELSADCTHCRCLAIPGLPPMRLKRSERWSERCVRPRRF